MKYISAAKALAIKYGVDFEQFLASLKTYHDPSDFPLKSPTETKKVNFTVGHPPD